MRGVGSSLAVAVVAIGSALGGCEELDEGQSGEAPSGFDNPLDWQAQGGV